MRAIILAAGEGMRMRPLTLNKPKPLLEIGGKVLLEHIVSRLPEEIDELVLVIGYLGDQIKNYCGNNFLGRRVSYVRQEKKLGTFHALKLCQSYIERDERFFVFNADDIYDRESIKECFRHERALVVSQRNDPEKFGVVRLNSDGTISEIFEKPRVPPSKFVSTGAWFLDDKIFNYQADLSSSGEYYLPDAVNKMLKDYKIFAVKSSLWLPVGCPEDLPKAEKSLKN